MKLSSALELTPLDLKNFTLIVREWRPVNGPVNGEFKSTLTLEGYITFVDRLGENAFEFVSWDNIKPQRLCRLNSVVILVSH